ncbi:MAG: RNA-binding protein [Pseudomonadota bacterium]
MKNFELTDDMLTMGGVFYPRGYAFVMFPTAEGAQQVASAMAKNPAVAEDLMLLSPEKVLKEIGQSDGESDVALPSVGTEGATAQKYVNLAREGHHALMAKVDSDEEAEALMQEARKHSYSYAQRYHLLAIEDLE